MTTKMMTTAPVILTRPTTILTKIAMTRKTVALAIVMHVRLVTAMSARGTVYLNATKTQWIGAYSEYALDAHGVERRKRVRIVLSSARKDDGTPVRRVPLKAIQERIGHALTGSFTLDVYGHQLDWESNAEAAKGLGEKIAKAVIEAESNLDSGPLSPHKENDLQTRSLEVVENS